MERVNGPDSTTGREPEARNLSETQLITGEHFHCRLGKINKYAMETHQL